MINANMQSQFFFPCLHNQMHLYSALKVLHNDSKLVGFFTDGFQQKIKCYKLKTLQIIL